MTDATFGQCALQTGAAPCCILSHMSPPSPNSESARSFMTIRLLCAASLALPLLQLNAQATLTSGVAPFVTVNAPVVALTHARLVDGTGTPARVDQTIIISAARITAVGPSSSTAIPAGAQVIDATGETVMPGQVGLHEHTYFGG